MQLSSTDAAKKLHQLLKSWRAIDTRMQIESEEAILPHEHGLLRQFIEYQVSKFIRYLG